MATKSFDEMMVIDTPEKAAALNAAYWDAEKRGPHKTEGPSFSELVKRGEEFLESNPDWLEKAVKSARERIEERGEGMLNLTEE